MGARRTNETDDCWPLPLVVGHDAGRVAGGDAARATRRGGGADGRGGGSGVVGDDAGGRTWRAAARQTSRRGADERRRAGTAREGEGCGGEVDEATRGGDGRGGGWGGVAGEETGVEAGGRRRGLDPFTNSPFVKCIFVRWWIRGGDVDDEQSGWGGVAGDETGVEAGGP